MSSLCPGVSLSQEFVARASLQTKLTSGHQRWILHQKQFSIRLRQEKVNPVKHHEAVQSEVLLTGLVVHFLLCWHHPATCNLIQWLCISKLSRHVSAKSSPLCKVLPSWAAVKASGLQVSTDGSDLKLFSKIISRWFGMISPSYHSGSLNHQMVAMEVGF